jgi:glycosyltransferase involved in cell wall biosynthesis
MPPRVSVLLLTYNRPQFIGKAIESILAQQFQEWELLVVHDGPNQEIPVVMEEWRKRDNRILYFHREIPGNIAEASNFGLAQARGEYIAVLDDDDYWAAPDKLSKQVGFLDGHRDHCCCGGGVIVVDPSGREQMRYLKPEHDEQIKRRALMANPLAHSTTLYRRESALRTGGYDETLAGFQDWDLWLKLGYGIGASDYPPLPSRLCRVRDRVPHGTALSCLRPHTCGIPAGFVFFALSPEEGGFLAPAGPYSVSPPFRSTAVPDIPLTLALE